MAPHAGSVVLEPTSTARRVRKAPLPTRSARANGNVILEALPSAYIPPAAPAPCSHTDPARRAPTEEEIRLRAYEIFQARGCRHGHDLDDWLQAERELRALP